MRFKLNFLFFILASFSLISAKKDCNKIVPAVVMTQLLKRGLAVKSPRGSVSILGYGTYVFKRVGSKDFWSLNSPR